MSSDSLVAAEWAAAIREAMDWPRGEDKAVQEETRLRQLAAAQVAEARASRPVV